jgi:16S rRNA (cytidine1402-2'-O)-methyltransferase
MKNPALYLIPVTLGDTPVERVIPSFNTTVISGLKYFIVENVRSARRFLKKCNPDIDIDSLTFYELNKHTNPNQITDYLQPMKSGESMGVISEAGCPAVADPGADVVAIAQQKGYKVVPLVGPSSILMAVMASGFNGQSFAFHGYLPIDAGERVKKLKQLEARAYNEDQTQVFIETPFRNHKLAEDILQHCNPQTLLCIAMNISCEDESIVTRSVKAWKGKLPDMHKKPTVFLVYRGGK